MGFSSLPSVEGGLQRAQSAPHPQKPRQKPPKRKAVPVSFDEDTGDLLMSDGSIISKILAQVLKTPRRHEDPNQVRRPFQRRQEIADICDACTRIRARIVASECPTSDDANEDAKPCSEIAN